MTTQPDTAVTGSPGKQKRQAFTTWSGVNIPVAPQFPEQIWLTEAVDDAVNKVYARMEKLFLDQKAENEAKEKAAEKALKSRLKKEKKERADERKELVDEIREMALELEDRDSEVEEPVVLKDAVGRRFIFPYEKCRTWRSFESLIRQAFFHVDIIGPQVTDGFFDILSPKGHVILPSVWDDVIDPGWEISMHMWPMAPPPPEGDVVEIVEIVEEGGRGCGRERLRDILEEDDGPCKRRAASPEPLDASVSTMNGEGKIAVSEPVEKAPVDENQCGDWDILDD